MNILSLSGFIPEEICDTKRFVQYTGDETISHYCGYAADYISQVLEDPEIDGAVFPRSCDSCRVIGSYLAGHTDKFLYQLAVPARRDSAAVSYLSAEIQRYQLAVERHYQIRLGDISQRFQFINERNQKIQRLYQSLRDISYTAYMETLHRELVRPLFEQTIPDTLPGKPEDGRPVYLIGPFLSNPQVSGLIEKNGMSIVGDNLTQSKRLFSKVNVQREGDLYEMIARRILTGALSPTQDNFKQIVEDDLAEIKKKAVQGVIFISQKYCEPYDYLFSVYKKILDDHGIPSLQITLSNSHDSRRLEAAVETFADLI